MVFKPLGCEPPVPGRWPQGLGNKGRPGWGGGGQTQPHGSLCRPSGLNGLAFEEHASAVSKLGKPSAYPKPTALLCSNDLRGPHPGLWAGGRCPQWPRHGVTAAWSLPHAVSCRRQCPGSPELRGQCPERQIRMVSRRGSGFPGPQTLGFWGGRRSTTYTEKCFFLRERALFEESKGMGSSPTQQPGTPGPQVSDSAPSPVQMEVVPLNLLSCGVSCGTQSVLNIVWCSHTRCFCGSGRCPQVRMKARGVLGR